MTEWLARQPDAEVEPWSSAEYEEALEEFRALNDPAIRL